MRKVSEVKFNKKEHEIIVRVVRRHGFDAYGEYKNESSVTMSVDGCKFSEVLYGTCEGQTTFCIETEKGWIRVVMPEAELEQVKYLQLERLDSKLTFDDMDILDKVTECVKAGRVMTAAELKSAIKKYKEENPAAYHNPYRDYISSEYVELMKRVYSKQLSNL